MKSQVSMLEEFAAVLAVPVIGEPAQSVPTTFAASVPSAQPAVRFALERSSVHLASAEEIVEQ